MSSFNLVADGGDLSAPGDDRKCSNYLHIRRHGLVYLHVKFRCTGLGPMVIMKFEYQYQPQTTRLTRTELCYAMSFANKWLYVLNVALLPHYRTAMIFTIHLKRNSIASSIKESFERKFNRSMNGTTPSGYEINICLFYGLRFGIPVIFIKESCST